MNIQNYGFEKVGQCHLEEGNKSGVNFILEKLQDKRVIYAFVVENQVMYIGICSNSNIVLKSRIARYQNMTGGSTNERITGLIRQCLENKENVEIWAFNPEKILSLKYKEVEVDFVKGLENPFINKFDSRWNIHK